MITADNVKASKILVVDDHSSVLDLVKTILRSSGYPNVSVASSGDEAIRLLRHNSYNLVICDWNMPGTTGLEVLQSVRANEESHKKDIPFLMLTAEAYRENVTQAKAAGVSGYIAKPFTPDIMIGKVTEVLSVKSSV